MAEIKNFLTRIDLFTGLSEEMLEQVARLCRPASYPAGQTIVERGTPPDNFYLIRAGTVKIMTAPEDGAENFANAATIILGTGQSFGEMGLIDQGPRSATVKADTDADLLMINCQDFRDLCETDINFGYKVMRNIAVDLSFKLRYRNLI
jgi:CRP/FNR family cyclic AMP-dependent transcriptional regulator